MGLDILAYNVHGLKNKRNEPVLLNYLTKFDTFLQFETFVQAQDQEEFSTNLQKTVLVEKMLFNVNDFISIYKTCYNKNSFSMIKLLHRTETLRLTEPKFFIFLIMSNLYFT